jgi:DNA-binding CsgD family transcriptional regulator
MRAQPSQAETRLVGSALIDLCAEVGDDEIATLPEVQRSALMTALLRGSAPVGGPEAVSFAFTGLLRALADHGPVVVAVDDVQWIDQQTADILTFSARRAPAVGIGILLARRVEPQVAVPKVLADLCAALPTEREQLGGLPDTTLEEMLRERLGSTLARSHVAAAIAASAGNPLFALEIARSSLAEPSGVTPNNLSLPASLFDAVGKHVTALDEPVRRALAAAAALSKPQLHQLRSLEIDLDLAPAERAGLVRTESGAILFTHPLYAAAAYDQLGAGERARLHRELAGVVDGAEEQARHLALGASAPDEAVAAALDAASERAKLRGAPIAALDAAALALTATTPDSPKRTQRLVRLGELLFRTGSTDQAKTELQMAVDVASTDRDRALAMHALAKLVATTDSQYLASELEHRALEFVGDDLELKADIIMQLALTCPDDYDAGLQYAIQAREVLEQLPNPDPVRLATATTSEAGARFYAGGGADVTALRRVVELQAGDTSEPVIDRAIGVLAYLYLWTDDYPGAREAFGVARQMAHDEGDDYSLVYIVRHLALIELRAGRWNEAELLIDDYAQLGERSGQLIYVRRADLDRARIGLYRGDTSAAVRMSEADIERGVATEQLLLEQLGRGMRGYSALVDGDVQRAAAELDRYSEIFGINGAAEPALREFAGEHIEALVLAGRDVDAEKAIDELVYLAEPLGRTAMLAVAERGRALLLAERGKLADALTAADEALRLYQTIERPFESARTQLVKGQILRRLRQKGLARRELTSALATFTELGAAGFVQRTQGEIERIGGRAAAPLDLTEAERRVADCAASGMTTSEIATSLFISTHTVSANLTRVYRKLNVRNRAELVARLHDSGTGRSADPGETV